MTRPKHIHGGARWDGWKPTLWLFAAYLCILLLCFLRYPLHGSLPGNMDIWFYVWQMNDFFEMVTGQATVGQILYPSTDYRGLVGSPVLVGTLYLPIKLILRDDLWGFYVLISTILALDATAFYLLAKRLKVLPWVAAVLGLLFAANNFTLSQIENFNAISFFPGLLSAWCFLGYLQRDRPDGKRGALLASAVLSGIQIYGSIYMFVFQFMLLGVLGLFHYRKLALGPLALWLTLIILIITPFRMQRTDVPDYLHEEAQYMPMKLSNAYHSIHFPSDLTRVHPGNLLYAPKRDIANAWRYGARSAFLGYSFYLALLLALYWLYRRKQWQWLGIGGLLCLLAAVVSAGPIITTPWFRFNTPMGWFNDLVPSSVLFRHVFRAYIYAILGAYLLLAFAWTSWDREGNKASRWLLLPFALWLLVENLPLKAQRYPSTELITAPADIREALRNVPPGSRIYILPSCHVQSGETAQDGPYNPVSREYIYAAWKSDLPFNFYNGRMGYLTDLTNTNSRYTCALDSTGYARLVGENEIEYLLVYKKYADLKFLEEVLPGLRRWAVPERSAGEAELFRVGN